MYEGEKIVTLYSYYDPMLAHIVRGRLQANGIECYVADELSAGIRPYLIIAMGGVSLRVFKKDEARCREILATDNETTGTDQLEPDSETSRICPFCGSHNVRYGAATEPVFHLSSLIVSLFFRLPVYFRNAWHCFNCYRDFE